MSDQSDANGSRTWGQGVGRVAAPLRDQVLNVMRQAILDFELKPGDRLIERELVERLQVSRTTVRDVLARLATEGLVTNVPQKGAIVTIVTRDEAIDVYEMRAALEPIAVRRFIERATPEDLSALKAAVRGIWDATEHGDNPPPGTPSALQAKDAFYEVLLQGARSSRLTQVLSTLQGQVQFLRATSLSVSGRATEAAAEISRVADAIEAGDSQAAEEACRTHVRNAAAAGLTRLESLPATDVAKHPART